MIEGETILTGAPDRCDTCNVLVEFKVMRSAAGWYIGTECDCGPYSRESGYFASEERTAAILECWRQGHYVEARR